jgi:Uma2 family endonuclease
MSISNAKQLPVTPAVYLEGERIGEIRHEYVNGKVYAMSGASRTHNKICLDVAFALRNHLKGGPCETFMEAVKVELADHLTQAYYYPNVVVSCDPEDNDSHIVRQPKLIVEILSPSTARVDSGEKLANYKRIPSVEEIVLIEQDWPEIFVTRRSDQWQKHLHTQLDSPVPLESIGLTLKVADFYASTPFPEDIERPYYLRFREDG